MDARPSAPLKLVVAGAGVAGLTVALAAARAGMQVVVVERAASVRDGGYMIDFFGSGYDAAQRLGLLPALAAIHYPIETLVGLDRRGRRTYQIPYPRLRRALQERHFNFMRGELVEVLLEALGTFAEIRYGREVQDVVETGAGLEVSTTDGARLTCDLLVGADGVHSRVRTLAFGADAARCHDLQMRTAAFVLPTEAAVSLAPDTFPMLTDVGRLVAVYPVRGGGLATFWLYDTTRWPGLAARDASEELATVFGDLPWCVPALLSASREVERPFRDDVVQVEMNEWSRGRVVLVGDACYAVSLVAGQGASLAMAGAWLLVDALARTGDVPTACAEYERVFRPFVTERQASGRKLARWFLPDAGWRLGVRDLAMKMSGLPGGVSLLAREFDARSVFA